MSACLRILIEFSGLCLTRGPRVAATGRAAYTRLKFDMHPNVRYGIIGCQLPGAQPQEVEK